MRWCPLTKNELFRAMLARAYERRFRLRYVLFDSCYSGLDNLKATRATRGQDRYHPRRGVALSGSATLPPRPKCVIPK